MVILNNTSIEQEGPLHIQMFLSWIQASAMNPSPLSSCQILILLLLSPWRFYWLCLSGLFVQCIWHTICHSCRLAWCSTASLQSYCDLMWPWIMEPRCRNCPLAMFFRLSNAKGESLLSNIYINIIINL